MKIYRILQFSFLALAGLFFIAILFYENSKGYYHSYENSPIFKEWANIYEPAKETLLSDPYQKNVLAKATQSKENFKAVFYSIFSRVSNLVNVKIFYDNIFILMVSGKMETMNQFVSEYFSKLPSFRDIVLIDKERNIIYQYNNTSFVADYLKLSNNIEVRFFGEDYGFLQNYEDSTLDYQLQAAILFENSFIVSNLSRIDFPAFFYMNGKFYRNSAVMPEGAAEIGSEMKNEQKLSFGINTLEIVPVYLNGSYLGTLGISYPSRTIGSVLWILVKILLGIFTIVVLFVLNIFLKNGFKLAEMKWRAMRREKINKTKKEAETEQDHQRNLDWIESYVQKNEGKE
jgi:hypothetical protein